MVQVIFDQVQSFGMLVPMVRFFGYFDPGSGSLILQALIGAVLGALIALKMYWARVKTYVSNHLGRGEDEHLDE